MKAIIKGSEINLNTFTLYYQDAENYSQFDKAINKTIKIIQDDFLHSFSYKISDKKIALALNKLNPLLELHDDFYVFSFNRPLDNEMLYKYLITKLLA